MIKPLVFAAASALAFAHPAMAAQPTDLPACLKPAKTLATVPVRTVQTTLVAQASPLGPVCTFTPDRKPAPVIRGLW
ncbi:hypothetical protein KQ306_06875 [Synechococcus sp. CS-1324]|uniref:hypothetical protein n=1 Tax=Synechococcus sp. CS-1324 TaxID=2847980 RepID=UPI00223B4177|nr:hypothetical protein [Synechococcus sp. CS-1324]MCT0230570.1 hypothetical protein [Synechococcus sp. CS-1324]